MLSSIFIFIARTDTGQSKYSSGTADWIKLTSHVCQHWRDIALGCPASWAGITFERRSWVEEMLKRSKMAPLSLNVQIDGSVDVGPLDWRRRQIRSAMSNISRAREIHIMASKHDLDMILSAALSWDTPFLKSLCLTNKYDSYRYLQGNFAIHETISSYVNSRPRRKKRTLSRLLLVSPFRLWRIWCFRQRCSLETCHAFD